MHQALLNLRPLARQDVPPSQDSNVELPAVDGLFSFTGHIKRMTRKGRFQYRFGRKVLPHDHFVTILPTARNYPSQAPSRLEIPLQPTFDLR